MADPRLERSFVKALQKNLSDKSPLLQVVLGPRQVGKTTGVAQLLDRWKGPSHLASGDGALTADGRWIEEQWQKALLMGEGTLLILDEIQKIPNWSEIIKGLWDKQQRFSRKGERQRGIKCVLLGSSSLSLQAGIKESLAGRFELHRVAHWSFEESRQAFGFTPQEYLRVGGYPGSYRFRGNWTRWQSYLRDSIVESVIGRDILSQRQVRKPALFRQAFEILCQYPAQEVSYTKLLGQLQDQGNTDLVKYYLELYEGAFLFKSLHKYGRQGLQKKTSTPKILPLCPALFSLTQPADFLDDPEARGRALELAVGVDLAQLPGTLSYWREGDLEVDFVMELDGKVWGLEVKSGRRKRKAGLAEFQKRFPKSKTAFIDWDCYPIFSKSPQKFLELIWDRF